MRGLFGEGISGPVERGQCEAGMYTIKVLHSQV
jgi:hypothetical protein